MPGNGVRSPDRIFMSIPEVDYHQARWLANRSAYYARRDAPKLTGASAAGIKAIYGEGWFGLRWSEPRVWFQNNGVHPFVMRALAGKTIPMWLDDPTGKIRGENPKAKTRTTESGRIQVLIFRRVALPGQRKTIHRKIAGADQVISVPMSYPGAPGRIAVRQAAEPLTTKGKIGGQISPRNVGIRWYFPGLSPRNFLQHALITSVQEAKLLPHAIHIGYNFYDTETVANYPKKTTSKAALAARDKRMAAREARAGRR